MEMGNRMLRVSLIAITVVARMPADTLTFKDGRVCQGKLGHYPSADTVLISANINSNGLSQYFYIPRYQVQKLETSGVKVQDDPMRAQNELMKMPKMTPADCEPIRVAGYLFSPGTPLPVKMVDAIDSMRLKEGDSLRGLILPDRGNQNPAVTCPQTSDQS
jgi:hypothetical protein